MFAVGAMVFIMVTGSVAFDKASMRDDKFVKIARSSFAHIYDIDAQLYAQCSALLQRDVAIRQRLEATRSLRRLPEGERYAVQAERNALEEEREHNSCELNTISSQLTWPWLHHPPESFPPVSEVLVDFIDRLLCADPARRMSVEDAMNHPWLRPTCVACGFLVG